MYKILYNKKISKDSYELAIVAPRVVNKAMPGQFVLVMPNKDSEKIPLTIYDYSKEDGILFLIYQVIGASTLELSMLQKEIFSVVGPLGRVNEICANIDEFKKKKIVYVAGGVGIAPVYPQVKYLHEQGINVDVIYGARNKDLLLIRDKIESIANITYVTDDGSLGMKGNVCDALKKVIDNYNICVSIGPVIMMKFVSLLTKEHNIKTIVSMNPIMVDGSGMCGACRCMVDGKPKFACIDGPEFDGAKVNFDLAMQRLKIYQEEEKEKLLEMKKKLGVHDGE